MQRGWNHFVFDSPPTRNPGEVKSCTQPFVLKRVAHRLFFSAFKNSLKLLLFSGAYRGCDLLRSDVFTDKRFGIWNAAQPDRTIPDGIIVILQVKIRAPCFHVTTTQTKQFDLCMPAGIRIVKIDHFFTVQPMLNYGTFTKNSAAVPGAWSGRCIF